jgi:hypothetical protein
LPALRRPPAGTTNPIDQLSAPPLISS